MTYFISGHRDITPEEFEKYYVPAIMEAMMKNGHGYPHFVVGDYWGVDEMAQEFLSKFNKTHPDFVEKNGKFPADHVTVYHMFEKPRAYVDNRFLTKGGFGDDESRDAAMTKNSDIDIAFVRPGKRKSGTAQNIVRRYEMRNK